MINLEKYAIGCMQANAIYSEVLQPLYVGNPLIEALPENRSREELLQLLLTEVPIDRENETLMAGEDREDCLQAIYQCFVPWSVHLQIATQMAKAIRSGYVKRNPCEPAYNAELRQLAACVQNKDPNFSRYTAANANAPGFSVVGYSGMGKTSAINHVLKLFPQILFHSNYQGNSLHSQLVWMKLECPFDGSVKGLCGEFFSEFDRLMNDNTYQRFVATSRTTTDLMIPQMALLARRHSLGVLVIDEIQNISAAKSGGTEKMLNFLGHLMNTIGVPIVLVGTQETVDVLSSKLMLARRNTGQGIVLMDHLNECSADWNLFVKGIWQYQWTREYTELSDELSDVLNEESFGIVDVAVKLFVAAQNRAILEGEIGHLEIITPKLIRQVANSDRFYMLKRQLERLKSPQKRDMADPEFVLWDKLKSYQDKKLGKPKREPDQHSIHNDQLQKEPTKEKQKKKSNLDLIDTVAQQVVTLDDKY